MIPKIVSLSVKLIKWRVLLPKSMKLVFSGKRASS
ncbi:maker156 [Drosophila busckii]|uniref:Maker156 n=1 Tax=Drosophila busckii TaxID=30019 RepID=A0A0M4F2J8_DROBS|nr:maker156 [Drosophila busckii]